MSEAFFKNWEKKSEAAAKTYRRILEKGNKNSILRKLPDLHEEATEKVNCLDCARCCKNYSPRFKTTDIRRISKHLGIRESELIDQYLLLDEDGDFVVKSKPCPFLDSDHTCRIYDVRPSDCARFPYTDEDVIVKRPAITLKNASFCPITFYVLEHLRTEWERGGFK